ncbi:MAG: hypothetical protein JST00_32865 [Deltaproteobacteria bacterium]|nr:hypothetical protein [Deltaproteobacteria bacterium]
MPSSIRAAAAPSLLGIDREPRVNANDQTHLRARALRARARASSQGCAVPQETIAERSENAVTETNQATTDAPLESCGTYKGMIFDRTNDDWVMRIIERYDDASGNPHYEMGLVYVADVIPATQWWGAITINSRSTNVSAYRGATKSDAILWSKNCRERPAKRRVGGELYSSAPFFDALNGSRVNAWDVELIAREAVDSMGRHPYWTEPVGTRFVREIDLTTAAWDTVSDTLPELASPSAPAESCGTYKGMVFDKTNDGWVTRIIERYDDASGAPHYEMGVVYVADVIPTLQWWGDFTINGRTANVSAYWGASGHDAIVWSRNCLERPAERKVGGELYASTPFLAALEGKRVKAWDVEIIAREVASPLREPFWTSPVGVRFVREIDLQAAAWDVTTKTLPP